VEWHQDIRKSIRNRSPVYFASSARTATATDDVRSVLHRKVLQLHPSRAAWVTARLLDVIRSVLLQCVRPVNRIFQPA
jgi:hypothetical protein